MSRHHASKLHFPSPLPGRSPGVIEVECRLSIIHPAAQWRDLLLVPARRKRWFPQSVTRLPIDCGLWSTLSSPLPDHGQGVKFPMDDTTEVIVAYHNDRGLNLSSGIRHARFQNPQTKMAGCQPDNWRCTSGF